MNRTIKRLALGLAIVGSLALSKPVFAQGPVTPLTPGQQTALLVVRFGQYWWSESYSLAYDVKYGVWDNGIVALSGAAQHDILTPSWVN